MARRSDHTREEIKEMALVATEAIVSVAGFSALSARKIAKQIGYTVGSLYLVFDNLDDLILQVNGRTLDKLSSALDGAITRHDNPESRLHALGKAYIEFAANNLHLWNMLFEHKLGDDGQLPASMIHQVDSLFLRLEAQFDRLRPGQSKQQLMLSAQALWSGVHGACMLSVSGKFDVVGVDSMQAVVERLIDALLQRWKLD